MNKYLLLLLAAGLIFASCNDNGGDKPELPPGPGPEGNPYITGEDLTIPYHVEWKAAVDEDNLFLGYGYDMTGKFAHPVSVKGRIFDMELFEREHEVTRFKYTSGAADYFVRGDAGECRLDMAGNAGFDTEKYSRYVNLFANALLPVFDNDNVFPELEYKYFGYSGLSISGLIRFSWNSNRNPGRYITDEFRADLDGLSAEELFEKYGTHMITGIRLGSRIDFLYRSTSTDVKDVDDWGTYYSSYYLARGQAAPTEPRSAKPLKDNLYFEFIDGSRCDPNAYMIDILNYEGGIIRLEGMADPKEENETMIGFTNTPVPVYELVDDPAKREELREAFEKYLGAR